MMQGHASFVYQLRASTSCAIIAHTIGMRNSEVTWAHRWMTALLRSPLGRSPLGARSVITHLDVGGVLMARKKVVFVLGGGGARGALQVGALRALLEAGYSPDLVVGTSIGAINAAFLGINGFNALALSDLEAAWYDAAAADLMPAGFLWQTVVSLVGRRGPNGEERMRAFLADHGLNADMRFGQLRGIPVRLVASDLNSSRILLCGADPEGNVLEGVLASAALPPWVYPLERDDRLLFDGGALSNLPIESALHEGATEVIALDLSEPFSAPNDYPAIAQWLTKLFTSVQQRHVDLELALAAAYEVPVYHLQLQFEHPIPIWDFNHSAELMASGYEHARTEIAGWKPQKESSRWPAWLKRLGRPR